MVSREELRDAVWGADTHVDFDRGIAYCLSQIRTALGDSGENPRFVQTIPKRGFKFIAPGIGCAGCIGRVRAAKTFNNWVHQIPGPLGRNRLLVVSALAGLLWLSVLVVAQSSERVVIAVSVFDNETGVSRLRSAGRGPLGSRRRTSHEDRSRSHRGGR